MKKFIMLLLLLISMGTLFAANSEFQQYIPIKSFSPNGEIVRPDSTISIELDTEDKNWDRIKNQFENNMFSITINDKEIPAQYNPTTHVITAQPGTLDRYTNYNINILIKSNLHGNGNNLKQALDFPIEFKTGSSIGEPTKGRITVDNSSPRVTENTNVHIELFDDYGNPATTPSNISLSATEGGQRLNNSFIIDPNDINNITAKQDFAVSNKEAENVILTASVSHGDTQFNLSTAINFRPGLPNTYNFDVPSPIKAGENVIIKGTVTDIYGNIVQDGETITVTNDFSNITSTLNTSNGSIEYNFAAPTKSGDYILTFSSEGIQKNLSFTVVANDPANIQLESTLPQGPIAGKVIADNQSTAMIKATVTDKYGNLCNGQVSWNDSMGLVQTTTPLSQGITNIPVKSNVPGIDTITCSIGNITKAIPLEFISVPYIELKVTYPANTTDNKVPADGSSFASITATVKDSNGNPYPYLSNINWSATLGVLSTTSSTLNNGTTTTTIKSTQTGISTITLNIAGFTKTVQIEFLNSEKPIVLDPNNLSIPGKAQNIGFNINTDGKFWIVREDNETLYTTILNEDKSIYKKDIKNPLRSYWNGHSLYYYNDEMYPSICPDGKGNMYLAWTRYYYGFNLMGTYYKADGSMGNGANYYMITAGDNRTPYLCKKGNKVELVWTSNANGGYSSINTAYGSMFASYYNGAYADLISYITTSGRAYDPALAYDSYASRWVFQTRSDGVKVDLVFVKDNSSETILHEKVNGGQVSAIGKGEGVWVAYVHNGNIIIRTISHNGVIGQAYTVAQGTSPILAKDNSDNIWMAWIKPDGTVSYSQLLNN